MSFSTQILVFKLSRFWFFMHVANMLFISSENNYGLMILLDRIVAVEFDFGIWRVPGVKYIITTNDLRSRLSTIDEWRLDAGKRLAEFVSKLPEKVVFVVSGDLAHYHPTDCTNPLYQPDPRWTLSSFYIVLLIIFIYIMKYINITMHYSIDTWHVHSTRCRWSWF